MQEEWNEPLLFPEKRVSLDELVMKFVQSIELKFQPHDNCITSIETTLWNQQASL